MDFSQNETTNDNNIISMFESATDTKFFYTGDHAINQLDNMSILQTIENKYTKLNINMPDSELRILSIEIFDNDKFIKYILNYYSITIQDLLKIYCSKYYSAFKGMFLKKFQKMLFTHDYT